MSFANPAVEVFVGSTGREKVWAQALIENAGGEFVVRHVADRAIDSSGLRRITLPELRKVAMFTSAGEFRPLRSAPDLARGWVFHGKDAGELGRAMQELYPGSIADWFAARAAEPPITHYREFTSRQSGMYRISQLLTDAQAANVARAACHPRFCLKRRLWTVNGLAADALCAKSEIPCLEPCAVLLELARKTARVEQEDKLDVQLSKSELESFLAAAETALAGGLPGERAGNIGSVSNPRRLQLLLEKFKKRDVPEAEE